MRGAIAAVLLSGLAIGTANGQSPSRIQFDPDGPGPDPLVHVFAFDWAPGNALADETKNTAKKVTEPIDRIDFQILYQTRLARLLDESGAEIKGTGLGSSYEITIVSGFNERGFREVDDDEIRVSHTSHGPLRLNYTEIYFDSSPDADPGAGTGFNDGILIYKGDALASGVFVFPRNEKSGMPDVVPMDSYGRDDNPGLGTAIGSGRGDLESKANYVNGAFFVSKIGGMYLRSRLSTPFTRTEPSKSFVQGDRKSVV